MGLEIALLPEGRAVRSMISCVGESDKERVPLKKIYVLRI